ncbi:MAG: prephenate dehydrogenase/arogenate dehydrogenase family protein [Candidatus Limnocylindria bacterium]
MRVGIAGAGLIGGSLALALRGAHDVAVFDTDDGARDLARGAGLEVVDRLDDLTPADVIVVATPLDAVVPTLAAFAESGAVLVDTGSLKAPVAAFARSAAPAARIVGGHPMAGSAASGFAAAEAGLFRDRSFLLVPTARSDTLAMAVAGDLARAVGAIPTVCSADLHDRVVAATSAAPLAAALALTLLGDEAARGALRPFIGPGFGDATRLAATPAGLATALLGGNPDSAPAIGRLMDLLGEVRSAAVSGGPAVAALLERVRDARLRARDGGGVPPAGLAEETGATAASKPEAGRTDGAGASAAGGPTSQRASSPSIS